MLPSPPAVAVTVREVAAPAAPKGGGRGKAPAGPKPAAAKAAPKGQPAPRKAAAKPAGTAKPAGPKVDPVVAAFSSPFDFDPIRVPLGSARPSAVAKLHYVDDLSFSAGAGTDLRALADETSFVVATRDPRRAGLVYKASVAASRYQWMFADGNTYSVNPATFLEAGLPVNPMKQSWISGEKIHVSGATADQIAGINKQGYSGVYVDASTASGNVTITVEGLAASTSYTFDVMVWRGGMWKRVTTTATSSAGGIWTYTVPAGQRGYYNLAPIIEVDSVVTVFTNYAAGASAVKHLTTPEFADKAADFQNYMVTAADILATNTGDNQYRGGMNYGVQVAGDRDWMHWVPDDAATSVADTIQKLPEFFQGTAEKGAHGPIVPSGLPDFQPVDMGDVTGPTAVIAPFDLDDKRDYIIWAADIQTPEARRMHLTIVWHVQFETPSQHYELRQSPFDPVKFERSIASMRGRKMWDCNPNHLAALLQTFRKRVLGPASALATQFAPLFGAYAPAVRAGGMLGSAIAGL